MHEEVYLLGYIAVYSVESQPTFQRNMSLPSSGSKKGPSKKPAWQAQQLCLTDTTVQKDLHFTHEIPFGYMP
jgi:hypothetical protein